MNRTTWLQDRRMQKFRDVLSRWERRELSMMEAGEVLGMSERQFRRYRDRFEEEGEAGLIDRRLGKVSPKRIGAAEVERMLHLYRRVYRGWNVKHFHEHGVRDHRFSWGYSWTKTQLHTAGLVERAMRRGAHRRKRERKPCEGMMLHQDGSRHHWLEGQALDLIVTMDDATSTIYSAFLVEEEGTASSLRAGLELISSVRDGPFQIGTTECSTCKMQMEQGSEKPTVHPIKLLALAYGLMPEIAELVRSCSKPLVVS